MRRLIPIALAAFMAIPAVAAKRETVAQFERGLTIACSAHKSDTDIAGKIGNTELTERLAETDLERLKALLLPGSEAAIALQLLAEKSAFLDLPASALPSLAAPDEVAQQRMIGAARSYVAQTLPHLPNFLATRTINRFDDSPQALKKGAWPVRAGLHRVDTSSREISVRDERENQPPTQGSAVWAQQIGLISGGEFGTTLGMILTDTLQGKISWGHWEQTDAGQAAVFQYEVPSAASHFELISTLQRQAAIEGFATPSGERGVAGIGVRPNTDPSRTSIVRTRPPYHGSISLDPATGTILRITLQADLKDSDPFRRAAILVEYDPVQIGDGRFICPVRSVALSQAALRPQSDSDGDPGEWLNETLFTAYHRFASTTRVLTDPEPSH
jgi:hypothetical protein